MLINRAEMRDAPEEGGGRNRPVSAGGASSGTARTEHSCTRTANLMEVVVERENMLNAFRQVVSTIRGGAGVGAMEAFVYEGQRLDEKRSRRKPYLRLRMAEAPGGIQAPRT